MSEKVSAGTIIRTAKPSARISHTRHGVSTETVLSKMIRDNSIHSRARGDDPYIGNFGYLHEVSDLVSNNIEDAINLNQLQPEVEICIQILTALILSPKDIINPEITHSVEPNILPAEMTGEMLEILKHYFEHNYKIKEMLPDKLRKALFQDGADVLIVVPENSLDDLINGRGNKRVSLESFKQNEILKDINKPLGFFGVPGTSPRSKMALEDLLSSVSGQQEVPSALPHLNIGGFSKFAGFVAPELCDNPHMLKLESITQSALQIKRRTILESIGAGSYSDIESLYHNSSARPEDIFTLIRQEDASRETIGGPLLKYANTEACIPVGQPGKPEKPIGFLFLVDEYGGFVSRASRTDYFRNISTGVYNNRSAMSSMVGQAASQLQPENDFGAFQMAQQASAAFRDLAIRDIEGRFLAGTVGNVTVGREQLAYDLMFERSLAGKQTRILYVPADMVVYWAYRFNDNGTGRSLMEDNKILSSIRALTLFMNVETMMRNSIDHRTLNITIDEDDPNKSRTKEMILHEYARQRSNAIPWATSNPRRMIEMAQQAGLAINMDGGDKYPQTKVSIDSRDVQYREINLSMDEDLRKRQTMGFGLAPEIVDLSNQIEFSSKIATSNELSLKRAILLQDTTNGFIRQTIIKITISHKDLMDKLRAVVGKHFDKLADKTKATELGADYFVQAFLSIYKVSLPRPDTGLSNRMTELDEYTAAIDKMLDIVLSDELLGANVVGESSNEWVGVVKANVKSTLTLRYCRENNILPQLTDLFKNDTEEDYGTLLVNDGLENTTRLSGIIKAVGLKLYAGALINENQWKVLKDKMDESRVEGTDAGEGSGGTDDFGGGEMDNEDDLFGEGGMDDEPLVPEEPEVIPEEPETPTPEEENTPPEE